MAKLLIWLLATLAALPLLAQTSRGTVVGTVMDSSGAVVPLAGVTLTHTATRVVRSATTNEAGIYRFDAVDLGVYDLVVAKTGFKDFLSKSFGVEPNRATTLDISLQLGSVGESVTVYAEAADLLVKDAPLRGGSFQHQQVARLPLARRNALTLAATFPGVILPSGTAAGTGDDTVAFSVNGQRPRSNNFLLDGVDNNNDALTGPNQPVTMTDAVEVLSAQTSNFSVEFGRAAGGIFNVITRSGTNSFHGTASWQYRSQRFESVSNLARLNQAPKDVFAHNIYGFTLGGPVRRNKTFFFGGFQQDIRRSTNSFTYRLPTAEAVERLRALFPSNPRLDLYLNGMGDLRGSANPLPQELGLGRGSVQFGVANLALPRSQENPQWLIRLDHSLSQAHRLSFRAVYYSSLNDSNNSNFPGYFTEGDRRDQNYLLTDSFTLSPTWTNELRLAFSRFGANNAGTSSRSVAGAETQPRLNMAPVASPGLPMSSGAVANNWVLQETQSKLSGRHTFRYGLDLLEQRVRVAATDQRGNLTYQAGPGFSAFANYLDDFSGPSGQAQRIFGRSDIYPHMFRQAYFFEDAWKATATLTLTLGLRYENFDQPANSALQFPAFTGFDPADFLVPRKVNRDDNNLAPAFGLAWSPAYHQGILGKLFGNGKTVWRGGFQISYDTFINNDSFSAAQNTPNAVNTLESAPNTGRGLSGFSARLPATPRAPSLTDAQQNALDKDLRNPYTERWSFGVQRELPNRVLLDLSYVGAVSHKLHTLADLNPRLEGRRLYPDFGVRRVRTSQGNSAYHSLQLRVDRRFHNGLEVRGSYTWSRNIDSTSSITPAGGNITSVPVSQGGLRLDRGLSSYHRQHRFTLVYLWDIPGPPQGIWRHALGGWSIAGITTFQSGEPYSVLNGFDRNDDALPDLDRPDIGNPRAPLHTRGIVAPACPAGYRNPDTGACVAPGDVHFLEGRGLPNAATVGRNTLIAGGVNNWDASLFKTFPIRERTKLEFRWEAFNVFNHPQYINSPPSNVRTSLPGQFLNRDVTGSGIRTMRFQLKVLF